MKFPRTSGVLLHPTSLPGPYGIGEIGSEALAFVDQLVEMRQSLWQMLPIGPTGFGDSPYQLLSTFAGNELIICFDQLQKAGLLDASALANFPETDPERADFGAIIPARREVLNLVATQFSDRATAEQREGFDSFCHSESAWLDDYALFRALKRHYEDRPWSDWAKPLIRREVAAMAAARLTHAEVIHQVKVLQFLFREQWNTLRRYANERGIKLIGDLPIFVGHDSADVWASQDMYYLDEDGMPTVVAGVPPDAFSDDGQRWGNPLYKWDLHRAQNYEWWIQRIRSILNTFDVIRIDHFRGFEKYWEIPSSEETAKNGKWVDGPDHHFFEVVRQELGDIAIIAEDLGVITEAVERLRDDFAFPGMRILHFCMGNPDGEAKYRSHGFPENCVVYTGTHDNDTTVGWYVDNGELSGCSFEQKEAERHDLRTLAGSNGNDPHWDLISIAHFTRCHTSIIPLQDLFGLGSEARMNRPGTAYNNWQWRFEKGAVQPEIIDRFRDITLSSERA